VPSKMIDTTQGLITAYWDEVHNPAIGEVLENVSCVGSRETSDAIASVHSTFNCKSSDFVHSILGQMFFYIYLVLS